MTEELSDQELERHAVQVERLGIDVQRRLKGARAIVVGAGPAGSTAAAHLASCGVGYVAVVDGGVVQLADLHGQSVLYTPDVGSSRAEAVVAKLGVLNPHVRADSYPVDVEEANAQAILMGHDVALDCRGGPSLESACRAAGVTLVACPGPRAIDGLRAAQEALDALAAPAPVSEGAPA